MKTPDIKRLTARFKTHNARAVEHEFHTVSSLARRVLVSRPTAYAMIERGELVPMNRDKQGRFVFLSAKLDAVRREVVDATTAEVLRALAPMQLDEREKAMHCLNALHELARRAKVGDAHELGITGALFKAAAGLGKRGGALRSGVKWSLRNPALSIPAAASGMGGIAGGVAAATDGNPDTGAASGAIKGGAVGGGLGMIGVMARKRLPFMQFEAGASFEEKVEALRKQNPMSTAKAARIIRRIDPEAYAALEESRKIYAKGS